MAAALSIETTSTTINASSSQIDPNPIITPVPAPAPSPAKCPWGQPRSTTTTTVSSGVQLNLADIMSEQLAASLAIEENARLMASYATASSGRGAGQDELDLVLDADFADAGACSTADQLEAAGAGACSGVADESNDEQIAKMLQLQFNKEYDEYLNRIEKKINGSSKVNVSLINFKTTPPPKQPSEDVVADSDSDDSDSEDSYFYVDRKQCWDSFEANEKSFPTISYRRGYARLANSVIITKHDATMNQRRNACRVMEFPPGIQTGDGATFDMKLSNKVYNNLKMHSKSEEDRHKRFHDKIEKSTTDWAIDTRTRMLLYKMINNEVLEKIYGIVSTGKESVILYATGGSLQLESKSLVDIPRECALKVFKTSLNEFKCRDKYIRNDYRFKDRFSKQNPRKMIHLWAEKEMHNLARMNKAGIPSPQVILLKKHILVLSFIGTEMKPAPKLKDVKFENDADGMLELRSAYDQVIEAMKNLFHKCNLIHSDLSEFNILWHENKCFLIDVSQAVEPTHDNGLEFLYRDCINICKFFGKRGLEQIHSPESLFTSICGLELAENSSTDGIGVLNQIHDYEKNVERLTFGCSEKSYPFEHCWDELRN